MTKQSILTNFIKFHRRLVIVMLFNGLLSVVSGCGETPVSNETTPKTSQSITTEGITYIITFSHPPSQSILIENVLEFHYDKTNYTFETRNQTISHPDSVVMAVDTFQD